MVGTVQYIFIVNVALPFEICACFTKEINFKKAKYMLNCDEKPPKKLVKHANITKFRQQNILESFLRPGAKVTLIFFNLSMFSREEIMVQLEKQWLLWEGIARNRISLLASDESS